MVHAIDSIGQRKDLVLQMGARPMKRVINEQSQKTTWHVKVLFSKNNRVDKRTHYRQRRQQLEIKFQVSNKYVR